MTSAENRQPPDGAADRPPASRPLGSFERAQALTADAHPFNLVLAVRLAGLLDEATLRDALDALQRDHVLLRTRLAGSGRGRRFEAGATNPIPLRRVEAPGGDEWRRVVEDELALEIPAAGPLARCVLVTVDGGESTLVLTLHHVIVDATSALLLLRGLLAHCSGVGAAPAGSAGGGLPPSADALFPPRYRPPRRWPASWRFLAAQLRDELRYRWRTRDRDRGASAGPFRCRVLTLSLTEAETTALVRASRRRRVGLFGVASAAMLLAVVGRRYGGRGGLHRYFAFPMLRPYLSPPVEDDVVAGYLTTLRLTAEVEPDAGLWPLAARIHAQTDAAVKRGERFLASAWSAFSMATVLRQGERMGTTALNYSGATSLTVAGAPFTVRAFHAFVGNFPLGPEYTAQTRVSDRRFWWDVVYLDVDMDHEEAVAIAEDMRALIVTGSAAA